MPFFDVGVKQIINDNILYYYQYDANIKCCNF